jgi:lipopolysaccharide/colanic/teichoic acid biosynthesis glycosyltransferase
MKKHETYAPASAPALRGQRPRGLAHMRRLKRELEGLLADSGPLLRRMFDILIASTALVLLSPVMLLAALGILLTSRGPILYEQQRVGQHGQPFRMLKLRTMVNRADELKAALAAQQPEAIDGVRFKLRRDPRTTPAGRILRKLSIDELPQLWNVLVGDMTLIGPRPPVWQEAVRYDARALRRLEVRPGLTCLWQVSGRSDLSFEQQVALDLEYIDRVKPRQELLILARTIPAVVSGRGAY